MPSSLSNFNGLIVEKVKWKKMEAGKLKLMQWTARQDSRSSGNFLTYELGYELNKNKEMLILSSTMCSVYDRHNTDNW